MERREGVGGPITLESRRMEWSGCFVFGDIWQWWGRSSLPEQHDTDNETLGDVGLEGGDVIIVDDVGGVFGGGS